MAGCGKPKRDEASANDKRSMTTDTSTGLLRGLREAHRQLDEEIEIMREAGRNAGVLDQLALARLKKRKLRLRDEIERAADASVPDLIA